MKLSDTSSYHTTECRATILMQSVLISLRREIHYWNISTEGELTQAGLSGHVIKPTLACTLWEPHLVQASQSKPAVWAQNDINPSQTPPHLGSKWGNDRIHPGSLQTELLHPRRSPASTGIRLWLIMALFPLLKETPECSAQLQHKTIIIKSPTKCLQLEHSLLIVLINLTHRAAAGAGTGKSREFPCLAGPGMQRWQYLPHITQIIQLGIRGKWI